jgi:ABC-type multidrug transport system ATPase subunit/pSer/pThr/pTyr-binding forkhead associated (FHA) protein
MSIPFARLEIHSSSGTSQEFLLDCDLVGIGRAPDNALVLNEPAISRYHARITREADRYLITDLGSSNGTCVNNAELSPRLAQPLADGDIIRIGTFELRFCFGGIAALPLSLPRTVEFVAPSAPVLRISTPQWTRDFPLERDSLVLGRDPASDITIDVPVVSARHAQLKRREAGYEITDLGSKNGLFSEGQRIAQKLLVDGDVLHIGPDVTLAYLAAPLAEAPLRTLDLRNRTTLSIGRDPQNDSVIDHPAVSRFHARITRLPLSEAKGRDSIFVLADLNSTNGTFVNGERVVGERLLQPGDAIRIGPCRLVFGAESLERHDEEGNLRLDALHLSKTVGKGMTILQDISLSILPREFVAIVGVSGAGKSTLLDALNGFRPATRGVVLVNGSDLYENFDAYRTELGYVPQDDIIHRELTVAQALDYAAQLRMAADTTQVERRQRIQGVLEDLDLTPRRDLPIHRLSGGQRKRVSIGVELLTRPSLFFLDEATSGLDPGTEAQMMRLLRKLADQGRTVLLVTHATKNVMMCDLVVFLAKGGRVAYFGPPEEALIYFGVQDFDEIYPKIESELSPEEWEARYKQSPQYQQYVVGRLRAPEGPLAAGRMRPVRQTPATGVKHVSAWRQLAILSRRSLAILTRDRASLALMLAIAPLIGLLDFVTWQRNLFDVRDGNAGQVLTMLFLAALIAILVGGVAAMREIVKEIEIYRRERMVGLRIAPYLLSKVWIGVLLALYQAAVFVLTKKLAMEVPGGSEVVVGMYISLVLGTLSGMAMGLLVSAVSPNQNVAPLLIVLILVPQFMFAGGMLPVDTFGPPGKIISQMATTKWVFEALVTVTGMGRDVAEDPCWQLPEEERKNLTEAEKVEQCNCLGPNLFTRCEFPGIQAKYDPAVDAPEPVKPQDPGDPPPQPPRPEPPTEQSPEAQSRYQDEMQRYEEAMRQYQKDIEAYQDQVKQYRSAMDVWQTQYREWKEKRDSAIGEAEGLIRKFHEDYGNTFNVNLARHWGALGLIMVIMFGLLVLVQKRKDVV